MGCHALLLGNLPNPGIESRSPALHVDSLPSEPPDAGKCKLFKFIYLAAAAKSLQSCPTRCHPIDSSPPGSPIPGILQARTLEWVAISFSNAWKWKNKVKLLSRIRLLATPRTAAYQAPPSMGFSRQEYWSGVPLPSPCLIAKWCLLFCNPTDYSLPGSSVHVIFQAGILDSWIPSPRDLPDPGIEPISPALASRFFTTESITSLKSLSSNSLLLTY